MRAKVSGCSSGRKPRGSVSGAGGSPSAMRAAERPSMSRTSSSESPARQRRAKGEQERAGLLPVRVVGGVQHLAGRDAREHVQEVDRAPDRGVEVDARPPGEALGERGEIGDAGVGDDERRLRIGVVQPAEVLGDRRQPAPAVDEDRHAALRRQREDRLEPLVVEQEALRPGVELDPARARVERARRLLDRLLGEVEADEGDEEAARSRSAAFERAVVGGAEGRLAVGLVQAEREGPLHAPALEEGRRGPRTARPCRRCRGRRGRARRRAPRPSGRSACASSS